MTTATQEQLPTTVEITPPATMLQEAETTLTGITNAFFDLAEKHADELIARFDNVVWEKLETVKGMDAALEGRRLLRQARTGIVDKGHAALKAPLLAVGRLADDRKAAIGKKLKAAEDKVDVVIKAEETRKAAEKAERERMERARVAAIRENIAGITAMPATLVGKTSVEMRQLLTDLTNPEEIPEQFQELKGEAVAAYLATKEAVERLIAAAEAQEEEQRRLQAERERLAQEEQRQREEQQRRDAEAEARQDELDRQAAELRRQQEEFQARLDQQTQLEQVQEPVPAEAAAEPSTTEASAPVVTEPAAPITLQPAEKTTAPARPTDEEILMVVAAHWNVAEDVAFDWLVQFSPNKKVA